MLAFTITEDWMGPIAFVVFWGGIATIGSIVTYVGKKRLSQRPRDRTIELAKQCPQCGEFLRGVPLTDEHLEKRDPPRAWRVCRCGFEEQVWVEMPWTKTHLDRINREEKAARERDLIADYERRIAEQVERQNRRAMTELESLLQHSPGDFERAVAHILSANGFTEVHVCGGPGDLAVDIECVSPTGKKTAVQCKRYRDQPVGSKDVQTFIGMVHGHHKIKEALFVTTSRFTQPAQELAKGHKITLVDGPALLQLADKLKPDGADDEEEQIRALTSEKESLSMWPVVSRERRETFERLEREKRAERIRNARRYGGRRRY